MKMKSRNRKKTSVIAGSLEASRRSARKGKRKGVRSFHPDDITTEIHQAIRRDLAQGRTQEYATLMLGPSCRKAMQLQADTLLKKYLPWNLNTKSLEEIAFEKFKKVNSYMERIDRGISFPSPSARIQRGMHVMDKIHLRARALMHFVLGTMSEDEFFNMCKHGKGSSIGVAFSNTSIEAKFTYPITTTARAKPLFERYLEFNFQLDEAIEAFNSLNTKSGVERFRLVEGSRATTVEKDQDKRRFIAVEPTANMYLQQGLMAMMYRRMSKVGLDVASLPDSHRLLAQESSITGKNATIDWSSASDTVSYKLVKWLLPPSWFSVLDMVRSPTASLNGENVVLHMFSTMGNAGTFPLETLVFWTYAHACRLTLKTETNTLFPEWEDLKCISVFGDDCIVPSYMSEFYIQVMELIGFTVNSEKSFSGSERFRESCGGDFLAGYPVRPFHLRAPSSNRVSALEPWLYIIMNRLIKKYISYFGPNAYVYDRRLFECFSRLFRQYKLKLRLVPSFFPDDAGLKISSDIERLALIYGFELHPIYRGQHGELTFTYCRYRYRESGDMDPGIRYCSWLKKPTATDIFDPEEVFNAYPIRKNGGYVVAKGFTSHWEVPVWKPAPVKGSPLLKKHERFYPFKG